MDGSVTPGPGRSGVVSPPGANRIPSACVQGRRQSGGGGQRMTGRVGRGRHHWGVVIAGVLVMAFGVAGASLPASGQGQAPAPAVSTTR
jgi:hypothetical protein